MWQLGSEVAPHRSKPAPWQERSRSFEAQRRFAPPSTTPMVQIACDAAIETTGSVLRRIGAKMHGSMVRPMLAASE